MMEINKELIKKIQKDLIKEFIAKCECGDWEPLGDCITIQDLEDYKKSLE